MRNRFGKQVDPRIAAVAILVVLAAVQWFWWQGLVARPKVKGGMPPAAAGGGGSAVIVVGLRDVTVSTWAGAPDPGSADGIGRNARFDGPTGVALDPQGDLYVADTRNHRIRRVAPDGEVTTVAGGAQGYRDGPAAEAMFDAPCGVAVGAGGAVFVADTGNNRIRRILGGRVTTVAGGAPGLADGVGAAARFHAPTALTSAPDGALLVADTLNHRLRRVSPAGAVTSEPVVPAAPVAVAPSREPAAATAGRGIWTSRAGLSVVPVDVGDQAGAPGADKLKVARPSALWPARDGWYAADAAHGAVFEIRGRLAGVIAGISTTAGVWRGWRDGPGDQASFGAIGGLVADGRGKIYVSDTGNNAIRVLQLPPDYETALWRAHRGSGDRRAQQGVRGRGGGPAPDRPDDYGWDFRPPGTERGWQEHTHVDPRYAPGADPGHRPGGRP